MSTKVRAISAPLRVQTIQRALRSDQTDIWLAGVNACRHPHFFLNTAQVWRPWQKSFRPQERLAALAYLSLPRDDDVARRIFVSLYKDEDDDLRELAWRLYQGPVPAEVVEEMLFPGRDWITDCAVIESCEHLSIPQQTSARWFEHGNWRLKAAALYARAHHHIAYDWIQRGIEDGDGDVVNAAVYAARQHRPPVKRFAYLMDYGDRYSHRVAMQIYAGRADALRLIERGLENTNDYVLDEAARACQGAGIPLETLQRWYKTENPNFRRAIAYASIGREDVPAEWIEDIRRCAPEEHTEEAAFTAVINRPDLPPVRQIHLASDWQVYVNCLNDVTVAATIPDTAHVCQDSLGNLLTNEIKVTEVTGYFCGEKVGVTDRNCTRLLRKGQHHKVANFNPYDGPDHGIQFYLYEPDAQAARKK